MIGVKMNPLTPILNSKKIRRILRLGIYFYKEHKEIFFYQGDDYWEVLTEYGNFPAVHFNKTYPENDLKLPEDFLEWGKDCWIVVKLLYDPFDEMEKLINAKTSNDTKYKET